jgi:hypothetical protein
MPPAPKTTFLALFAEESSAALPSGDAEISAALDAYGAIYNKGSTKKQKEIRAETLAGLSWLHLNHGDVASALQRIAVPHQQMLASALGLDYDAYSAKPQWPTMLSRAIAARAVPGDTPVKRKDKKKRKSDDSSSRAEKPSAEMEDDDVDEVLVSDEEADPWSAPTLPLKKKPAKGGKSSVGAKKSAAAASPSASDEDDSGAGSAALAGHDIPPMPDSYSDSADVVARADKLCKLSWIGSTLMANCLPIKYRRILYLDGNLSQAARREYDKMVELQRGKASRMSRVESISAPLFPHRMTIAFGHDEGLAADGRALALIAKCERSSDFGAISATAAETALHQEYKTAIKDLQSSWDRCTAAIRHDALIPGVSSDTLIARIKLMLARRYRCLAKEMLGGPARQEVLANTHRQIREVSAYISTFMEDLATRSAEVPFADQPKFVGERFLTLFKPTLDVLLGNNTGSVPGGLTVADLQPAGGSGAAPAPASQPAARRSILRAVNSPAVSFASDTTPAHDDWPAMAPAHPAPQAAHPPPWPPGWPYGYGAPAYPYPPHPSSQPAPAYASPSPAPAPAPAPAPRATPPSAGPSPAGKVKAEPINAKSAARKNAGLPTTLQPQHVWVTGQDCAIVSGGAQHPKCNRCPRLAFHTGLHASWDCPLRYFDVFNECPGFNRDGSRDPAQWHGENLTRAAKDAWVALIAREDIMVPVFDGAAAPPFSA